MQIFVKLAQRVEMSPDQVAAQRRVGGPAQLLHLVFEDAGHGNAAIHVCAHPVTAVGCPVRIRDRVRIGQGKIDDGRRQAENEQDGRPQSQRLAKTGDERRRAVAVALVFLSQIGQRFPLLAPCQPRVHVHQDREHEQGKQGWPLQQESEHDRNECHILWMAYQCVGTAHRHRVFALGAIEHSPCGREQDESAENEHRAQQMKWADMRVAAPAEHHLQQVPGIVREPIGVGETG